MAFNYILLPFSFIYYIIVSVRNIFYRLSIFKVHSFGARVISVGNITWGGTGKTPVVAFIAGLLLKEGRKPAILLRGYGNDEERLFLKLVPGVLVKAGKDRIKTGNSAIASGSVDALLLDDGFQYRRLKKDLDIVCIDAANPFGNGLLVPSGSLREGLSGLKRADIFLITKVDLVSGQEGLKELEGRLKKINPNALIVKSIHSPGHFYKLSNEQLVDVEVLKNKNIALLSAIGNPVSFESIVSKLGLRFKRHFIFRDHHWYTKKDLTKIENYCVKQGIEAILTTEKDAVKLSLVACLPRAKSRGCLSLVAKILILHIELKIIDNEQGFYNRLFGIYNS